MPRERFDRESWTKLYYPTFWILGYPGAVLLPAFTDRYNAVLEASEDLTTGSPRPWGLLPLKAAMDRAGFTLSRSQLSNLRSGATQNPSGFVLLAIATTLAIDVRVFFDEAVFSEELQRLIFERDARRGHELGSSPERRR